MLDLLMVRRFRPGLALAYAPVAQARQLILRRRQRDEKHLGLWLTPDISVHGATTRTDDVGAAWFMAHAFMAGASSSSRAMVKFRARPGQHRALHAVKAHRHQDIEAVVLVVEYHHVFLPSFPQALQPRCARYKKTCPTHPSMHVRWSRELAWNFPSDPVQGRPKFGKDRSVVNSRADKPLRP